MEGALGPGAGADEPSGVLGVERADGRLGNSGEPSRPRRLRAGGKRCPAYNRRTREVVWVVERQSERVVVLGGRESRPQGEGPALHRCTGRMRGTLMSAESARSVSRAKGVDRVTVDDVVASGVGDFLDELAAGLRAGTYRPRPLRRVHIPKPGKPGQLRPLGIPCLADRVVMAAAKIVLEPIFEADFLPASYGFRPRLSAHHALETVRQTVTWGKKVWALDADIQSCL